MIFKLQGTFQHYDWGGEEFIPQWLNLQPVSIKPYAEYWLGAHRSSPSCIEFKGQVVPLDMLLAKEPDLLGQISREQFGTELPFLLKILDVKQPLSIQLHPTKAQAEAGFEQENQAGIPLDASHRTYKDRNHKPEMMIALSDFWLLHGFCPIAKIKENFSLYPSLQPLYTILEQQGIEPLYQQIMQADQASLAAWLIPIIQAKQIDFLAGQIAMSEPDYWLFSAMQAMNIPQDKLDAGLLCFYLFNIVKVKKGEGIYQGAGLPHAYLQGQCIELMAASDNVIRGGLTSKYIDIPALLQTADYREIVPQLIQPATEASYLYPTAEANDFALWRISFNAFDEQYFDFESAAILLVMQGCICIEFNGEKLTLAQGEAIFIGAECAFELVAEQEGYAVIASLPPQ